MRFTRFLIILCALPAAAFAQPLALEAARKEMLEANPQARAAAFNLEAADSNLSAARAGFYPNISASASYDRSGSQGLPAGDSYSYGVNGTQPLFAPAVPAAVRAASAARNSARASYDAAVSLLDFNLRSAFADIVNAREVIRLSSDTLKRREENLELIRLKYKAGRENKAALMETEAVLKTAQWQHERYKKNLRLLERKFNRLLGLPALTGVPELVQPALPAPPEDFSSFSAQLGRHYAIRSARAATDSARAAVDSSASSRLPQASASGGYLWSGSDWPQKRNSWSVGASLSLPLFSSGRLSSGLAASRNTLRSAEASLKNAEDGVYINAEDSFLSWREASAYMDVARSSMDAAEARAWLVRKQYLAGQSSYFEWRNVEEQLINEQNQYLAAGRTLAISYAAFAQAVGE